MVNGLLGVVEGETEVRMRFDSEDSATTFAISFGRDLISKIGLDCAGTFPMSEPVYVNKKRGAFGVFGYVDDVVEVVVPADKYHAVKEFLSRQMEPGVA